MYALPFLILSLLLRWEAEGKVEPPVNISCPGAASLWGDLSILPTLKDSPSSQFPASVIIINDAKNPIKLSLCASKTSDVCGTEEDLIECTSPSLESDTIGLLSTPPFLQYILVSFCSVAQDRQSNCFELPVPLQVDPSMLVGLNSTYTIEKRPRAFCETDADCPGPREFCSQLDTGAASVCEFRACRITCMCNHILNDYAFGDSGQWIVLDVFSMVCMILTAFFILYFINSRVIFTLYMVI